MRDNTWPATAKQRAYGMALEQQLAEDPSDWVHMNVSEASSKIDELVTLKEFRRNVGMPTNGHTSPVSEAKVVVRYGDPSTDF